MVESQEVRSAKAHLLKQGDTLKQLFVTMNPTDARLQEWKKGLDEVQSNLKTFDATYKDQPVIKNGVAVERDSLGRYITQCIATYNKHAKTPYAFAEVTPASSQPAPAGQSTASSGSAPASDAQKHFNEGEKDGESVKKSAGDLGQTIGTGLKHGAEVVSDAFGNVVDAVSGDNKEPKKEDKKEDKTSSTASDKNKPGLFDKFDAGGMIGGLLGAIGGWMAGNMFGGGMFGTIAGILLAIPGMLIGNNKLGPMIQGWISGKKEGAEKGNEQSKTLGASAPGQSQAAGVNTPAKTTEPAKNDAQAIYDAHVAKLGQGSTGYVYFNPAMDPNPQPVPPQAGRKVMQNFRQ